MNCLIENDQRFTILEVKVKNLYVANFRYMPKKSLLLYISLSIVASYFLFLGLVQARAFLAPLATAVVLSLLVLPLSQRMERVMSRSLAAFLNTFFLFLISVGLLFTVSLQLKSFAEDWPSIKKTMAPKISQLKNFTLNNTPLTSADLELDSDTKGDLLLKKLSGNRQKITGFMGSLLSFMANYLLTFIYVFFLLNYRKLFKEFLIHVFKSTKEDKTKKIILKSAKVVPQYLLGKLILMGLLAVVYSIGLGISGVNNFILVSFIAALLTLIPYVGNIIGFSMAVVFGYLATGEISTLIGIVLTFTISQFLESYVLQPYVVGNRVDVHPFFVIIMVILGNLVWGIIGMILAIPIVGILAVIFLNIDKLRPFGILLSKKNFSKKT